MAGWEYLNFIYRRPPAGASGNVYMVVSHGSEFRTVWEGPRDAPDQPSIGALLDGWGSEGWELVGPPLVENTVVTDHASGMPNKSVSASELASLSFWMKRALG